MAQFGYITVYDWNPSCDAADTDANDVLAATEELTRILPRNDQNAGGSFLSHVTVIDKADVGGDLDIVIFDSSATLGTEDEPVSISDADAAKILAIINVTTFDDLINSQVSVQETWIPLVPATKVQSLYAGIIARTGGTYGAAGLTIRFGITHT